MRPPMFSIQRPRRWKVKSSGSTKYDVRSTILQMLSADVLPPPIRQSSIVNRKFLLSSPHEPGPQSKWIDSRRRRIDADGDGQSATGLATARIANFRAPGTDVSLRSHSSSESIH